MLGRALRLSALPSLQGSQVLGSPFPFPNTEGRLKMGQCQSLPKGPRRRGPQGKPWQDTESDLGDQIRGYGVKSVVTEQRYRPAQQGSPPIPVEPSLESRRAANPERYGPVEHFVVTKGGKGRWISLEQKYRPAEHGSKPIPVYDARDYGDHVCDIVPR